MCRNSVPADYQERMHEILAHCPAIRSAFESIPELAESHKVIDLILLFSNNNLLWNSFTECEHEVSHWDHRLAMLFVYQSRYLELFYYLFFILEQMQRFTPEYLDRLPLSAETISLNKLSDSVVFLQNNNLVDNQNFDAIYSALVCNEKLENLYELSIFINEYDQENLIVEYGRIIFSSKIIQDYDAFSMLKIIFFEFIKLNEFSAASLQRLFYKLDSIVNSPETTKDFVQEEIKKTLLNVINFIYWEADSALRQKINMNRKAFNILIRSGLSLSQLMSMSDDVQNYYLAPINNPTFNEWGDAIRHSHSFDFLVSLIGSYDLSPVDYVIRAVKLQKSCDAEVFLALMWWSFRFNYLTDSDAFQRQYDLMLTDSYLNKISLFFSKLRSLYSTSPVPELYWKILCYPIFVDINVIDALNEIIITLDELNEFRKERIEQVFENLIDAIRTREEVDLDEFLMLLQQNHRRIFSYNLNGIDAGTHKKVNDRGDQAELLFRTGLSLTEFSKLDPELQDTLLDNNYSQRVYQITGSGEMSVYNVIKLWERDRRAFDNLLSSPDEPEALTAANEALTHDLTRRSSSEFWTTRQNSQDPVPAQDSGSANLSLD